MQTADHNYTRTRGATSVSLFLLAITVIPAIAIAERCRKAVDVCVHHLYRWAFRRLHGHRHYVAFWVVRAMGVTVSGLIAVVLVPLAEVAGALGLWMTGRALAPVELRESLHGKLDWYGLRRLGDMWRDVLRELRGWPATAE